MQTRFFTASGRQHRGSTATLGLCVLLGSLGTSIANVALPALAAAFDAPFARVQAVVVAYLAALTVSVLGAGWLGDRCGLRPMLLAGLCLFATGAVLGALAPGLWPLVAARALQGMGAAFLLTLGMAMMRQTAAKAQVGRAMGLLGTLSALGTALGPALAGLLIPLTGWRGIFWVQVPLAGLALLLAATLLPRDPARQAPCPAPVRHDELQPLRRALLQGLFISLMVAAVMMTTLVVGPFYLGAGLGLTTAQVGLVMTVGPVLSILAGAPSGRLTDLAGPRRVLVLGLALMLAGALGLAVLPGMWGLTGYLLAIALLTPGYQMVQAANTTAALADLPLGLRGRVSGLLNLSRNIGLIAGATVMAAIFARGGGAAGAPAEAISAGMTLAFLVAGAMIAAALLAARYPRPGQA